ncbi:MAG TPA: hypothetical protein VFG62_00080 [Rhodopila sp.]|nr:hypothetical protein [Rhodopila sp.]
MTGGVETVRHGPAGFPGNDRSRRQELPTEQRIRLAARLKLQWIRVMRIERMNMQYQFGRPQRQCGRQNHAKNLAETRMAQKASDWAATDQQEHDRRQDDESAQPLFSGSHDRTLHAKNGEEMSVEPCLVCRQRACQQQDGESSHHNFQAQQRKSSGLALPSSNVHVRRSMITNSSPSYPNLAKGFLFAAAIFGLLNIRVFAFALVTCPG